MSTTWLFNQWLQSYQNMLYKEAIKMSPGSCPVIIHS